MSCFIETETEMWRKGICPSPSRVGVETGFQEHILLGTHPESQGKDPLLTHHLPSGLRPLPKGGAPRVPGRHLGKAVSPSHWGCGASPPSATNTTTWNDPHSFPSAVFHFMGGFICVKNASAIPPGFRNIILLFLKLPLKNLRPRTHTPLGECVGGGVHGCVGSVGAGEGTAWPALPRAPRPAPRAHGSERTRALQPRANLRRRDPGSARAADPAGPSPSRSPGRGHGRRVTSPGADGTGGEGRGGRAGGD